MFLVEGKNRQRDSETVFLEVGLVVPEVVTEFELHRVAVVLLVDSVMLGDVAAFEVVDLAVFELLGIFEIETVARDAADGLFHQKAPERVFPEDDAYFFEGVFLAQRELLHGALLENG